MNTKLKAALIIVVAAITTLVITLFVSWETPLKVDALTIEKNVMAPTDYNFSMVYSTSASDITTVNYPIFNASADCSQDVEMAKLLDKGELLASADMDDQAGTIFAGEDVVRFKSKDDVAKFVQLVKDGYANEHCSYNSKTVNATFGSKLADLGTAKDFIEVGNSDSVAFTNHVTIDAKAYNWHIDFTQLVLVIPADDTLVLLVGTVSKDANAGIEDMKKSLTTIAKKAFGHN